MLFIKAMFEIILHIPNSFIMRAIITMLLEPFPKDPQKPPKAFT